MGTIFNNLHMAITLQRNESHKLGMHMHFFDQFYHHLFSLMWHKKKRAKVLFRQKRTTVHS